MAKAFEPGETLHVPEMVRVERDGIALLLDPERGNWIGTDDRGAALLELMDGKRSMA